MCTIHIKGFLDECLKMIPEEIRGIYLRADIGEKILLDEGYWL